MAYEVSNEATLKTKGQPDREKARIKVARVLLMDFLYCNRHKRLIIRLR
jgi:hypothetical protein